MLMRPEYRKDIAEAYKKKIESIVRKPAKTEEVHEKCLSAACLPSAPSAYMLVRVYVLWAKWARRGGLVLHDTPLMARHAPGTGRGGISMPVLWDQVTQLPARLPAVQKPGALLHRYRYANVTVLLPRACNCRMEHV
jgi:hypothetical protein